MSQKSPIVENLDGAAYRAQSNQARQALMTNHKGSAAPAYAEAGMTWCDDTDSPWLVKCYDGADWITLYTVNPATNKCMPYVDNVTLAQFVQSTTDKEITDAAYTLIASDGTNNTVLRCNSASAQTITIPPEANVNFAIGTVIAIEQYGVGQVTIAAGVGVTINSKSTLKLSDQYTTLSVRKVAADEWLLIGDMEAA